MGGLIPASEKTFADWLSSFPSHYFYHLLQHVELKSGIIQIKENPEDRKRKFTFISRVGS